MATLKQDLVDRIDAIGTKIEQAQAFNAAQPARAAAEEAADTSGFAPSAYSMASARVAGYSSASLDSIHVQVQSLLRFMEQVRVEYDTDPVPSA